MTTTTFTDGETPVVAAWLNDVDAATYETLPTVEAGLAAHIADTLDAHAASAITNIPAGNLIATDVQAALNELDTEKQPLDAELSALAALTSAANQVPIFTGSGTASTFTLTSGVATTLTGYTGTNITAIGVIRVNYIRIGDIVVFSGHALNVAFTAANTYSEFSIDLPVTTDIIDSSYCTGTVSNVTSGLGNVIGSIVGDTVNDRILFRCQSASTGNNTVTFSGTYLM